MDDLQLESLAVKEIIAEIERNKRIELESRRPPERKIRPNKRFLGRTIVSVLQHNKRQHAEERRNSSRKLRELDKRRRRRSRSRSRSKEHRRNRHRCSERYERIEHGTFSNETQVDLTMYFLNNMNHLLNNVQKVPTKDKTKKKRTGIRTIDLTKKNKRVKERKKYKKTRLSTIKSKKRRRRKDSSSSSSSNSSISTIQDSDSISSDSSQSSTLLIDLT